MSGLASALGEPSPPNPAQAGSNALNLASQTATGINTPIAEQNQAGSNYQEYGPTSSLTYGQVGTGPGGVPIYGATTQYTPQQEALLQTLQGTQATAGGQAGSLLSGANYGAQSPTAAIGNLTSGLTGQNVASYLSSADPFFQTQASQLDTSLRNQGLAPGQPAYDNAMRQLNTSQGLSVYGAAAQFEPQAFTQATTEYELPAALSENLAGFAAPASPTAGLQGGSALNIQTPNTTGDVSAEVTAAQNQYTAQQAQYNAMVNGLMGVGTGAALALSDVRLKRNITKLAKLANGLFSYCFRYLWDNTFYVGVMAHEVERLVPDAIVHGSDGYLRVNYGRLGLRLMTLDEWLANEGH
jgi:hypothetical protein